MSRRDTPELILGTALVLFNELGEPNVTTNQIADEADISPGNLYYHFRSKDDIALELFKRFLVQMQPLLEAEPEQTTDVEELCLRLHLIFEAMAQYRFLYRNLADLHARIPNLRYAMHGLLGRERNALNGVARRLCKAGVMEIEDRRLEMLTENVLTLITYWIPFAEITGGPDYPGQVAMGRAMAGVLYQYHPYLDAREARRVEALAQEYLQQKRAGV